MGAIVQSSTFKSASNYSLFVLELTRLWVECGDRRPDKLTINCYYSKLKSNAHCLKALRLASRKQWFPVPTTSDIIELCAIVARNEGRATVDSQAIAWTESGSLKLRTMGELLKSGRISELIEA